MRVLIAGWPSFVHGEATAGDVLSMRRVRAELTARGIDTDTAWSPNFMPDGLSLTAADPSRYTHVVFVCGPVHGWQLRELHQRFAQCLRIAVGVSVLDTGDWRHCARPDEFLSILARLDAVLTTRLHGLVMALREGVPALAVDPVRGGGKVSAQADALGWPAVVGAAEVHRDGVLDHWWRWCLSSGGRTAAAEHRMRAAENAVEPLVDFLAEGQVV